MRGVTSNPAIFSKVISESQDYNEDIQRPALEAKSAQEIYEALAIAEIQSAADLLLREYESKETLSKLVHS